MKNNVKRKVIFSVFVILIFEIIASSFFSVRANNLNASSYSKSNGNYNYNNNANSNSATKSNNNVNGNYNNNIKANSNYTTKSNNVNDNDNNNRIYDYYIESYNVDIDVSNDNIYNIKETIVAYFNKEKHGIIRNIPTRNTVIRTDGKSNTNRARVTNINVNENYTESRENNNVKLKIGNASTVLTGRHTYQISYTYNIGNDKLKNEDEFYLNLIGNEWDTNINKLTFTIKMPKDFDTSKIGFSAGKYGTSGIPKDGYFNYSVENNVIKGTYNKNLSPNNVFTVRITLPDGYFDKRKEKITIFDFVAIILPILFVIIAYMEWKKYGKDDKPVETVEFYPPDNMNSLDVAYVYKGNVNNKDVVSLLVCLANKGYIKIKEFESSGLFKNKSYKIIKLREYNGNDENEKIFFDGLFSDGGKYVTESDLKDSFYKTIDKIIEKENKSELKDKIFEKGRFYKTIIPIIFTVLTIFTMMIRPILCGIETKFAVKNAVILIAITMIYYLVMLLSYRMKVVKTFLVKSGIFMYLLEFAFMIIILSVVFGSNSEIGEVLLSIGKVGVVEFIIQVTALIFIIIFGTLMRKRTQYGTEIFGKILGFKTFLKTAEKEKLEMLVNQDPEYFYNILPYAYVLGVSNEWIKKFETISMSPPDWYAGDDGAFDYYMFTHSFNKLMNSSVMTSIPPSKVSNSGGGDFFSGGGGFSGGGSGGGGGSSW